MAHYSWTADGQKYSCTECGRTDGTHAEDCEAAGEVQQRALLRVLFGFTMAPYPEEVYAEYETMMRSEWTQGTGEHDKTFIETLVPYQAGVGAMLNQAEVDAWYERWGKLVDERAEAVKELFEQRGWSVIMMDTDDGDEW
jgi:hypothetical protein